MALTQLYFERQAALASLQGGAGGAGGGEERARLQRGADELAAGLDGWTGGWFGTAAAPPDTRAPPVP